MCMFSKKIILMAIFAFLISPQIFAGGPRGSGECVRESAKALNKCWNNGPGRECEKAVERAIERCIPKK